MVRVQKNIRIEKEIATNIFPLLIEALQEKTDRLAEKHFLKSRKIKEADLVEYMIRETLKDFIKEGYISKGDPDLENIDLKKYL